MAIRYPLQHLAHSHKRRTMVVVAVIIAVSIMIATARLIDYYWVWLNYIGLDPRPAKIPQRPPILQHCHKIYLWGLVIRLRHTFKTACSHNTLLFDGMLSSPQAVIQIVNFLLICIFNALLLLVIAEQKAERGLLALPSEGRQSKVDRGAVALLFSCVLLYLATQAPAFIYNVWDLLSRSCISQMSSHTKMILAPMLNVLLNLNSSANFMLYCGASPKFRKGVRKLVLGKCRSKLRRLSLVSTKSDTLSTKQSRSRRLRSLSNGSTHLDGVHVNRRRSTKNQEELLPNLIAKL